MRTRLAGLVPLLSAAAFAQAPQQTRVLAFAQVEGSREIQEFVNAVRSIAEISNVAPDFAARTITVTGTADQIGLATWLLGELDRRAGAPSALEFRDATFDDPRSPAVKVCFAPHLTTPQQLQETVNAVRSVVEVQRLVAMTPTQALILRATPEQSAFAEWLIREADAAASGAAPRTTSQYTYPDTLLPPERRAQAVRIYHPAMIRTPADLQELAAVLRTIAEVQRVVVLTSGPAIPLRGSDSGAALADWLMHELDQPPTPGGGHEYQASALNGQIVRTFFPASAKTQQDLLNAVNAVRQSTGIQRAVAYTRNRAVILRGTPDQLAAAAALLR